MVSGIQWQVATNAPSPVVFGATHTAGDTVPVKDVVIVLCDAPDAGRMTWEDTQAAAGVAHDIVATYQAFAEQSDDLDLPRGDRHERFANSGTDHEGVALRLSRAVTRRLSRAAQPFAPPPPIAAHAASECDVCATAPSSLAVLAIAIYNNQLFVARAGGGQVYLLRKGRLHNLIDETFLGDDSGAGAHVPDPAVGQLTLRGEDRVLICNQAVRRHVTESRIKTLLGASPSSRRTVGTLIDTASLTANDEVVSAAVIDFVASGSRPALALRPAARQNAYPAAYPTAHSTLQTLQPTRASIPAVVTLIWAVTVTLALVAMLTNDVIGRNRVSTAASLSNPPAPLSAVPGVSEIASVEPEPTSSPTPTPIPQATATLVAAPTAAPTAVPTAAPSVAVTHVPAALPTPTIVPTPTANAAVPERIELSSGSLLVGLNSGVLITVTVYDSAGRVVTEGDVTWSPHNVVLSLGGRVGIFTSNAEGVYAITASYGELSSAVAVVVDKDWRAGPIDLSFAPVVPLGNP